MHLDLHVMKLNWIKDCVLYRFHFVKQPFRLQPLNVLYRFHTHSFNGCNLNGYLT